MAFDKLSTEQGLHIDDFVKLYNEAPFEWIDGEKIPLVPGVARHIETIRALVRILDAYAQQHQLGEVYSEAPFVLEYKSDWVHGARVPDVMFSVPNASSSIPHLQQIGVINLLCLYPI